MPEPQKRILIIDDDEAIQGMVGLMLQMSGYEVKSVSNGEEALEEIQRHPPDAILLDMRMPIMSGWEFAKEFRSRFSRKIPLLVNTAAENAEARAREIDADGFISKPFEMDDLLSLLARHLDREK